MRRVLLASLAIAFALACGDDITEPTASKTTAVAAKPLFATTTTEDGLSISTDKDDYQPGDVVHLTGYGWQPGDVLDIVLTDDPLTHDPHTWAVSVDEQGMFHDSTYVVDEGDLNVSFTLVATSRATGRSLTVNFTDSQPQTVTVTPTPQSVTQGSPGVANYTVAVTQNGNATACTMTISVPGLPSGVSATFTGGLSTFTTTTSGNFSTSLTINTTAAVPASTITITAEVARVANCQGSGTTSGSGILNVVGPAAKLAFVQQPTNATGGATITPSVTVQVLDAADHPVSSSALITLAIGTNPAGGTLSGTPTQAAVNGLATFPGLSVNKAGNGYTLTANSTGLTGATSNAFNISVGAFSQLGFTTQPGGATAGIAFSQQPVVAAQDAGGNIITSGQGSAASITLAIQTNPSGGTLICTTNPLGATNGVATFAGCRINNAGNGYQLRASNTTAGTTRTVDSDLFNIVSDNVAPVLAAIGNKTVAEDTQLAFAATATDENVASLQFSLANPATGNFPTGASITAAGAFTWTPSEAQGPGVYRVKVVVTDNATLTDEEEIQVTVTEVNQAPTVTAIPDKTVNEEAALTFTASATDPDVPANTLTFSLQAGTDPVPSGASINSSTGAFTWTPTEAQGPGVYEFKVRATDDGTPSLFGEANLKITVNEVNKAPDLAAIGNKSVDEGSLLSFAASATDPDLPPNTLTFSLDGAPAGAAITSAGAFTWTPADDDPTGTSSDNSTFKVVVKDDGTPQLSDDESITVSVNNVKPTITSLTKPDGTPLPSSILIGGTVAIKVNFTDPGTNDTHTAQIDCGTGYTSVNGGANVSTGFETSCTFASIGPKDIKVTVTDDDGGVSDEVKHTILVTYNFSGFFAPVDRPNTMNISKVGQAIPLKWRLTDASGRGIAGVTGVTVQANDLSCTLGSTERRGGGVRGLLRAPGFGRRLLPVQLEDTGLLSEQL